MKLLLAISGGVDSMFLANLFAGELVCDEVALPPAESFSVAHCNFCLRGEESDGDEAFVREWCAGHSIEFFSKRFDTRSEASRKGISIEMAARELRYSWFAELISIHGFDAVAVAHNANDNAETLILNLLRGTGMRGISGMESRKGLIRPLLGISRETIVNAMVSKGLSWREDSSNAANDYKRNKIRNQVFPVFKEINPSFLATLEADMSHFSQAGAIADDYFNSAKDIVCDGDTVNVNKLLSLAHWKYVLFRLCDGLMSGDNLNKLCLSLENGNQIAGKRFGSVIGASGRLILKNDTPVPEGDIEVKGAGTYVFLGKTILVEKLDRRELDSLKQPDGTLVADYARLGFPFRLRAWKEGDWMIPLGMRGRKKLSNLFADLKFSAVDKAGAIVVDRPGDGVTDRPGDGGGHVLALLGKRIDSSLKVRAGTSEIIRISLIFGDLTKSS